MVVCVPNPFCAEIRYRISAHHRSAQKSDIGFLRTIGLRRNPISDFYAEWHIVAIFEFATQNNFSGR